MYPTNEPHLLPPDELGVPPTEPLLFGGGNVPAPSTPPPTTMPPTIA